jgi:hypothetical protein
VIADEIERMAEIFARKGSGPGWRLEWGSLRGWRPRSMTRRLRLTPLAAMSRELRTLIAVLPGAIRLSS